MRTAWDTSQEAEALAAQIHPGDEAAAAAAARRSAIRVAIAVQAREEESATAAARASLDAAVAVHNQEGALSGIRFNTAVHVALNEIAAPSPD